MRKLHHDSNESQHLGDYQKVVASTLKQFESGRLIERLWDKDPILWKKEPEHQSIIRERLGWLDVVRTMQKEADLIHALSLQVKGEGFKHVVLLGMGGSSLCPLVLRETFGRLEGFPELHILDSTDPATLLRVEEKIDLKRTLWIVSSKSGGTIETESLFHYFYDKVGRGKQYIAITDAGTSLDKLASARKFRRTFLNPPDIGGRYSALSFFGLVPAALMGIDIRKLLRSARTMMEACLPEVSPAKNPGAFLGAILGTLYLKGRDKVTLLADSPIQSFGTWVEQLLAESTGKEGKGLVPVAGEAVGPPEVYGADRLFVHTSVSPTAEETERKLLALSHAGHPVVNVSLANPHDLGGEFFRWEFATAVAGSLLKIDAFDQPNVQESKDNTKAILEIYKKEGKLPTEPPLIQENALALYAPKEQLHSKPGNLASGLAHFLQQAKAGDYPALMAYFEQNKETDEMLSAIRINLRNHLRLATTLGYGPRFLHSTGQLHKGGADNGLFIQLTIDDEAVPKIPGEPYGFGTLKAAQALGDYKSLEKHGRRLIRIHLGKDIAGGMKKLLAATEEALKAPR